MAVPSSGTISLWGLAKEKTHDNYANGVPIGTWQNYYFPNVSLTDATTGAGAYEGTNQNSSSRPDGSSPYGMAEWHGYDHDATVTTGPTGKCLLIVDHGFVSPGTQTGCDAANAIAGATGAIITGGSNQISYNSRFGRYKNTSANTVTYNIRVYRQYSDACELKIYKGTQPGTQGYTTLGQTLVHTHTNTGYQTFTGSLNSGSELLIYFGSVPNTNATRYASFDQFYVGGACNHNGTMYAVPLLGSSSSTAYQYGSAQSAWNAGYNQRFNSSSWSTAYIHQCAGSAWAIGNTIYQTNSSAGSEVAFNGTGWRCGAFSYYNSGYPGGGDGNIIAFYNAYHATGNIENTYYDPLL
jgi:hypothetical protein